MLLNSIEQILEHIKSVEQDSISLSKDSLIKVSSFLEKNSIEIDDDVAQALQYQDIISQRLGATIEAIENMQENLRRFGDDQNLDSLQIRLEEILKRAKDTDEAFSGNVNHSSDSEIEFF
jgi:hypothetical protein